MDNAAIQKINKQFRGKNKPTDVVSLSYISPKKTRSTANYFLAGEIFISIPYARKQAQDLGHAFDYEVSFLFIHGLLHVFGYDHEKPQDYKEMFDLTDEILMAYRT
ncbi:MAG: rRNA maturation RNase YbeY [Bacteroidetes bacterium RIFCSPHIGHO2_02_FULL_44_7]|nr:MAG: rRNA maturation RNase YbeY [Bacteroidetes bacterium RIFCSPHIGHO2_02_FULL_44_7]